MTKPNSGMTADYKNTSPFVNIPFMSDCKWQYMAFMDRLEHPNKYIKSGEDVEAVIERLKIWLSAHSIETSQISA